ncbi:hypothetical protein [Bdellovibrio sp. NC01]|uniref:hypothetical protein n=1 Tax=Bdellovibrio sp. NC01 TaxID=2220073 RepID=UPI00115BFB36|nr:hypothetical protein [Bdellovibrio sp. NC01]QDK38862.1 hypothetical protein DOE51_15340 [Bdellovibrio sp. NC01]
MKTKSLQFIVAAFIIFTSAIAGAATNESAERLPAQVDASIPAQNNVEFKERIRMDHPIENERAHLRSESERSRGLISTSKRNP